MASSPLPLLLLLLLLVVLLQGLASLGAAQQSGCAARTFSKNRRYALCNALPALDSALHWTHDPVSSTLRLAFSAAPARPGGWVCWGVNPVGATMLGTQALLAFRKPDGTMDVDTYNVSSYDVGKSKIAYDVTGLEAEYGSDGRITIFANMKLPAGTANVTQVWQVGSSVTNGVPDKHAMEPANMASKGTLALVAGGTTAAGNDSRNRNGNSRCAARTFSKNRLYALCNDLPALDSALHWTHDPVSSTLRLAFSAAPDRADGWVSWGVNPVGATMLGTQALLAFRKPDGTMDVDTYNVSSYAVGKSKIAYDVTGLEAEYESDGRITIFANMKLPAGTTEVTQVWQVGPSVTNGVPDKHAFAPANLASKGTLDLVTGSTTSAGTDSRLRKRNTHGVLNAVSWGILLPIGAIIARYLKTFKSADPAWFYLHVCCQLSGYIVGVAGWGTGLNLGSKSKGVQYTTHRSIGIALFCLGTLQIFALFLRPQKEHKYRIYWNAYHHSVGYAVISLAIVNVFKGFSILKPDEKWRTAYIVVIAALGVLAVFLEVITWIIYLRRRSSGGGTKPNLVNGHSRGEREALPI